MRSLDLSHQNTLCGSVATNGLITLDQCAWGQWPKCRGPGHIQWTDCENVLQTRDFTFQASIGSGLVGWIGEGEGFSVVITWIFGEGPTVDVMIDGCDVEVTNVRVECNGPNGDMAIYFDFTGTCGECEISGCGAFGAGECEALVESPCCDNKLPKKLKATLSSAACAAANGQVVELEWNGVIWTWSGAFGGNSWSISVGCQGTTGSSCAGKWAIGGVSGCQPSQAFGQSGCSCDPISVTFVTTVAGSGCVGCLEADLTVNVMAA